MLIVTNLCHRFKGIAPLLYFWVFFILPISVFSNHRPVEDAAETRIQKSEFKLDFKKVKRKDNINNFNAILSANYTIEALKDDAVFKNVIYYDDNITIDAEVNSISGKKPYTKTASNSLLQDDIFHSDARIYTVVSELSKKGNVAALEYVKEYNDIKYLVNFYFHEFQNDVKEKEIVITIPEWLEMEIVEMNFDKWNVNKQESTDKDNKIITYSMKDLKKTVYEERTNGPSYDLPHLLFLFKKITTKEGKVSLINNTQDLYNWYHSLVKQVKNNSEVLKPVVKRITEGKTKKEDIVSSLFYWVQDNIRYIAFEDGIAGFKPAPADDVYKKKYGDCKGMANLLKEMLILAGYDARLTWVGTRHLAYSYDTPCLAVDNHMICTLIDGGQKIFLDPTEKYIPFKSVAYRIQGQEALIEDGDKYILEAIPEYGPEINQTVYTTQLILEDDVLTGKGNIVWKGESKASIFKAYYSTSKEDKDRLLKNYITDNKNIYLEEIELKNVEDRAKDLSVDYDVKVKNAVILLDNEVYVNLDYDGVFQNFIIDDKRIRDIVFPYKISEQYIMNLSVPEGYKVQHVPENMSVKADDYSISIQFEQKDNQIIYTKNISLDNAIIRTKDFVHWNKTIKQLNKIYKEQIVLKK